MFDIALYFLNNNFKITIVSFLYSNNKALKKIQQIVTYNKINNKTK